MHCTSALSIKKNAFKNQNRVTVVQASKIEQDGHCRCDFRHIPVLLKTWIFWTVSDSSTPPTIVLKTISVSSCQLQPYGLKVTIESEVTSKHWSIILEAESQRLIWETYGPWKLWDVMCGNCNLHHCQLTTSVPWVSQKQLYQVVQLVGMGNIFQKQCILPMGICCALLDKKTEPQTWMPVLMLSCTPKSNIRLCP